MPVGLPGERKSYCRFKTILYFSCPVMDPIFHKLQETCKLGKYMEEPAPWDLFYGDPLNTRVPAVRSTVENHLGLCKLC